MADMLETQPGVVIQEGSWAGAVARLEEARRDRCTVRAELSAAVPLCDGSVSDPGWWESLLAPALAFVAFASCHALAGEPLRLTAALPGGLASLTVALLSRWERHLAGLPADKRSPWHAPLPAGVAGSLGALIAALPGGLTLRPVALMQALLGGALLGGLVSASGSAWRVVAERRASIADAQRTAALLRRRDCDLNEAIDRLAQQLAEFERRGLNPLGLLERVSREAPETGTAEESLSDGRPPATPR